MTVRLVLPWPPSVNHYYRHVMIRGRPTVLISAEGRRYRRRVAGLVLASGPLTRLTGDLEFRMIAHPPDRRERDLDNLKKAIFDSLQHAGLFAKDSQIKRDDSWMKRPAVGGYCEIELTEIDKE